MPEKLIYAFTGTVKEGKLTLDKRDKFLKHLTEFEGQNIELTLRKAVKRRTSPQLRYYFVCVGFVKKALNDMGNEFSQEQVHQFLKSQFLFKEVINEDTAEIYKIPLSMSNKGEVSTDIMSEYIDKIHRWAAEELGVVIPDADADYSIDERYYVD